MTMHRALRQIFTAVAVLFLWVAAAELAGWWPWDPDPAALALSGVGFFFLSRWP